MRILHIYDSKDSLIARHVSMLQQNDTTNDVKTVPTGGGYVPDIVHLHGCWNHSHMRQARHLQRQGARLVLSPHHQLQPWVTEDRRLQDKWPKQLLWQQRLCHTCYCMIASGPWEEQTLRQTGWNPRIETVADAVISQATSARDMTRSIVMIYRKVMDSHPAALLSDEARRLLPAILKAGLCGDSRWVATPASELNETANALSNEDWRHLYVYAYHSGLSDIFAKGLELLKLQSLAVDASRIAIYMPQSAEVRSESAADVAALLRDIRHDTGRGRLSYGLLADMTRLLRDPQLNEDRLMSELQQHKLGKPMASLLTVLAETMQLDEGYMPCPPADNRLASAMRHALQHHLAI